MATLKVEIDGETLALAACDWVMWAPCGCPVAVTMADWAPPECPPGHPGDWVSVFGHTVLERGHVIGKAKGGGNRIKRRHLGTDRGREAMGIDWMNRDELSEAIPPAYTQFIGEQLLAHLQERAA